MDNTGLVRVVMGAPVPLVCQPFSAPIGGSSDSRTAYTPLDDLDRTMKKKSSDAQLAREIEVALPVELSRAEQLALVPTLRLMIWIGQ